MLNTLRKNYKRFSGRAAYAASLPFVQKLGDQLQRKAASRAASTIVNYSFKKAATAVKRKTRTRSSKHSTATSKKKSRRPKKRMRSSASAKMKKNLVTIIKDTVKKSGNYGTMRKIIYGNVPSLNFIYTGEAGYVGNWEKSNDDSPWTKFVCNFTFFNMWKLNDAASVLYNGKAESTDWRTLTDNFPTNETVLEYLYASASLEFVNMTQITYDVVIHECTSQFNQDTPPIDLINEQITQRLWVGGVPTVSTDYNMVHIEGAFKLSDIKLPGYTLKSTSYPGFMPGQKINWFQSRNNFKLDLAKTISNLGTLDVPMFTKGSVSLILELRPQPYFVYGTIDGGDPKSIFIPQTGYDNPAYGIGVTVKELYKVDQPQNTQDAYEGSPICVYSDQDRRNITTLSAFRNVRTAASNYITESDRLV